MATRYIHEWRSDNPDAAIPPRVKVRLWAAAGGRCEACTRKIADGENWQLDHTIALINGGEHAEANLRVVCGWCHKEKTAADVAEKSRVYRKRAKHLGIKPRSSRPLPGSKASGIRRRMSGEVERW